MQTHTNRTAVRPEDLLPDDTDHAAIGGLTVRKGTIGAFLQNAMRWSDPSTADADRETLGRAIAETVPVLRALDLFTVLDVRDERLRVFIANI